MSQENIDVKLARIEEKLSSLLDKFDSIENAISKFSTKEELEETEIRLENAIKSFVTKDEFMPVRTITYSLVGTVLLGFLGAVMKLIY